MEDSEISKCLSKGAKTAEEVDEALKCLKEANDKKKDVVV